MLRSGRLIYGEFVYKLLEDDTAVIYLYRGKERALFVPEWIDGYKVTGIWERAFRDCISLEEIILPKGVARIGFEAFLRCVNLKSIILQEGLIEIGGKAFCECGRLRGIQLPEGVKSIGYRAFYISNSITIRICIFCCPILTTTTTKVSK